MQYISQMERIENYIFRTHVGTKKGENSAENAA